MAEDISITLSATTKAGAAVSVNHKVEGVEAIDLIRVTIPKNTASSSKKAVAIQPGDASDVLLLIVRCVNPEHYKENISYATASTSSATSVRLDNVHSLLGTGAVGLLDHAPKTLYFSNPAPTGNNAPPGKDIPIEILVGRKATS